MPRRIGRAVQRRRRLPGRNPEGAGAFCAAGSSRGLPVAPGYKAAPRSCPHRKIPPRRWFNLTEYRTRVRTQLGDSREERDVIQAS